MLSLDNGKHIILTLFIYIHPYIYVCVYVYIYTHTPNVWKSEMGGDLSIDDFIIFYSM